MNIIILVGGISNNNFINENYSLPKPLIYVKGRHLIFYLIDNLVKYISKDDQIYIIYSNLLKEYNFESIIKKEYPITNFIFNVLTTETKGPIDTLYLTCKNITNANRIISFDHDGYYNNSNILSLISGINNGVVFFNTNSNNQDYSYIDIKDTLVLDIQEKKMFPNRSHNHAVTGCYIFENKSIVVDNYSKDMIYISDLIKVLINKKIQITPIRTTSYICLGTPLQIKSYNKKSTHLRFCFDLDGTLVTFPTIKDDYTSVEPIQKNIDFLNNLKKEGHTIIIHTARGMKSNNSNLGITLKNIGMITFMTLEKFNIVYDEIYFGKPNADFYIDDKAINAYSDLQKDTGFYFTKTNERIFNKLEVKKYEKKTETYIKRGSNLEGEIYYYDNIPIMLLDLFPAFISSNYTYYEMEKINGVTLSYIYINKNFTKDILSGLLKNIKRIHDNGFAIFNGEDNGSIYSNYSQKLKQRYNKTIYSQFQDSEKIFNILVNKLDEYESKQLGSRRIIHGDLVFTNILIDKDNNFKFIDMRGKLGNKLTIQGDMFYDCAKIYQSLIGYDFILHDKEIDKDYTKKWSEEFLKVCGKNTIKWIKVITASLLFSLIPLHIDEGIEKCQKYYTLSCNLINE